LGRLFADDAATSAAVDAAGRASFERWRSVHSPAAGLSSLVDLYRSVLT
jgi:hypothetical protein